MLKVKDFKKWILPVLMFVFCEFIIRQKIFKAIFYNDLFVLNFFDNVVVNKLFSFGLVCLFVSCMIFLVIKFVFNGKFNSIDSSKKFDLKKSIIISLLFFIFTMLIIYTVVYIERILDLRTISLNTKHNVDADKLNWVASLFWVSFVSIFEETVYRQILFGYLYDLYSGCNKYLRIITSVLVSSIIFGSIHDGVFHLAMIQYIIYGISFSTIYLYTKRISASMTVHVLINIFLVIKNVL